MRLADVFNTFNRDLLEVLRDRRSLVFMILLPTLIIPLIVVLLSVITKEGVKNLQATPSKVAVIGQEYLSDQLREYLLALDDKETIELFIRKHQDDLDPFVKGLVLSQSRRPEVDSEIEYLPALIEKAQLATSMTLVEFPGEHSAIPEFLRDYSRDYLQESLKENDLPVMFDPLQVFSALVNKNIADEKLDAVIVFHPEFSDQIKRMQTAEFTVFYSESHDRSRSANRKIRKFLGRGAEGEAYTKLQSNDLSLNLFSLLVGQKINVGEEFNVISRILPYFIILTCFIGGLYPALDNLAGAKERQTLETLLLVPAKRSDLMIGKYLLIFVCSVVSAVLCMISLSLTLISFGQGIEALSLEFRPVYFFLSLLLIVPLAAVFAAILMTLSLLARGYKEAQSYIMPINFLIIIPAFYSLIPGTQLGSTQAIIPVINVSLALREVWSGITDIPWMSLILASSLTYAVISITFCAYLAGKESVLFRN